MIFIYKILNGMFGEDIDIWGNFLAPMVLEVWLTLN